ncbi:putative protein HEADING DATE 3A-like [Capsicum annuum]|nr:putative protein HEADING DATE 3A-like [Capsicum annuum]
MENEVVAPVTTDLKERFDNIDGSSTFNLCKEIATLVQGNISVAVYFTRVKELWVELEALVPPPSCNCNKSRDFLVYLQRQKLYQFLVGINDNYMQARSQILMMVPLPSVNQAYAMIINDGSQKSMTSTSSVGLLGAMTTLNMRSYSNVLKNYRFKKKGGVPYNNYMSGSSTTGLSAHNAYSERYKEAHNAEPQNENSQVKNMMQPGACTFTQSQLDQIVQLLNQT